MVELLALLDSREAEEDAVVGLAVDVDVVAAAAADEVLNSGRSL